MPKAPRRKLFKFNDNSTHQHTHDSRTNSSHIRDRRLTPQLMNSTFDENLNSV